MLKHLLCAVVGFLLLSSLVGCQSADVVYKGEETGTTCANITMGGGKFAYDDGIIYFYNGNIIYKYDLQKKKVKTIDTGDTSIKSIFLSDDCVFYVDMRETGMLEGITKDGKKKAAVLERDSLVFNVYADGEDIYYISGGLRHLNMETGEETDLVSSLKQYYVDDKYIYVAVKENGKFYLLRSERGQIDFQNIELSFDPIAVYAHEDSIYLARKGKVGGDYQIIRYQNGEETWLPIYGLFYQVMDNYVIYMDSHNYNNNNSSFPVKAYDLQTGEERLLCESAYNFCILEQRYICFQKEAVDGREFLYYDWQTGEMVLMYKVPIN